MSNITTIQQFYEAVKAAVEEHSPEYNVTNIAVSLNLARGGQTDYSFRVGKTFIESKFFTSTNPEAAILEFIESVNKREFKIA